MNIKLAQRTYLNRDKTKAVSSTSEEAAFLLGCEGATITQEKAKQYGIGSDGRIAESTKQTSVVPESEQVETEDVEEKGKPSKRR